MKHDRIDDIWVAWWLWQSPSCGATGAGGMVRQGQGLVPRPRMGPGQLFSPADDGLGPDFPGAGRRRGMGFALRFLSDRLEATPSQERVIAQAVEEFRTEVEPLRQEGKKTRADLAAALRKSSIDEVLFGELFARHDEALEKGRKAFIGVVAKIHDALDEKQRDRLADLVERGPRVFGY